MAGAFTSKTCMQPHHMHVLCTTHFDPHRPRPSHECLVCKTSQDLACEVYVVCIMLMIAATCIHIQCLIEVGEPCKVARSELEVVEQFLPEACVAKSLDHTYFLLLSSLSFNLQWHRHVRVLPPGSVLLCKHSQS